MNYSSVPSRYLALSHSDDSDDNIFPTSGGAWYPKVKLFPQLKTSGKPECPSGCSSKPLTLTSCWRKWFQVQMTWIGSHSDKLGYLWQVISPLGVSVSSGGKRERTRCTLWARRVLTMDTQLWHLRHKHEVTYNEDGHGYNNYCKHSPNSWPCALHSS